MAYTNNDDFNFLQASDGSIVGAGLGNDRYVLDASSNFTAGQVITIIDTDGLNKLQLTGGLSISSSRVTANAIELVLNTGTTVRVLGADKFEYITGGNGVSGTGGTTQNFNSFVTTSLGLAAVPTGDTPITGTTVTVNANGGTTATPPVTTAPTFSVTGAASALEGATSSFVVNLVGRVAGANYTVNVGFTGTGSSTAGTDFVSTLTLDPTAAAGITFNASTGLLTIPSTVAGTTASVTLTTAVAPDAITPETGESMTITLSGQTASTGTAAVLGTSSVVTAITDVAPQAGLGFTLTTAVDTGSAFTGGSNDDSFLAVVNDSNVAGQTTSLNAGDSLTGGLGNDVLRIIDSSSNNTNTAKTVQGFFLNGVETVSVQDVSTTGTGAQTFDLSNAIGLTTVAINASSSTGGTVFTRLPNIVATEITNSTGTVTTTYTASVVAGSADIAKLTLNGAATTAATSFNAAGIETLNVVTAGAASGDATLVIPTAVVALNGTNIKTLNISGNQNLVASNTLQGALLTSVTEAGIVDASTMTGKLDLDLTGAVQVVAPAATFLNVKAGTVDDTIRVATLNTNMTIAGGTGSDTLRVNGLAAGTNDFANVTGFEKIAFAVTTTANQNLAAAGAITDVTLVNGSTGLGGVSGIASGLTLNYEAAAVGVNAFNAQILNAATSTTDVLNVKIGSAATTANIAAGTLTANGVETINLSSNSKAEIAAGNHAIGLTDTALKTLVITGNESLVVTGGNTTLTSVNASAATSGIDVSGLLLNATAVTVIGGLGDDSLSGAAGNDVVTGNAGDDLLNGGAGNDTLTAGDGNDVLVSGGTGNDSFDGGAGNDRIIFAAAQLTSADTVVGGLGNNVIAFSNTLASNALTDASFTNITGIQTITAANSAVTATVNDGANNTAGSLEMTLNGKAQAAGITTVSAQYNATTGATTGTNPIIATVQELFTNALTFNIGNTSGLDNVNAGATTATITVKGNAAAFNAADTLVGGSNSSDKLSIVADADATGANLAATSGFETIDVLAGANTANIAKVTIGSANVLTSGKSIVVNATALNNDAAAFTFDGSAEVADAIAANTGRFNITSGAGADIITGGAGADTIVSGANTDVVSGGAGNDSVNAEAGNDYVDGGAGNDTIDGGLGDDTVYGAAGADKLTGGDGKDTFVYSAQSESAMAGTSGTNATSFTGDTITDFNAGDGTALGLIDKIQLPVGTTVTSIGTVTLGTANIATFQDDLSANTNLTNLLTGGNAVVLTVSSGTAAGTYLVAATTSAAYSSTNSIVIKLENATNLDKLTVGNFTTPNPLSQAAPATSSITGTATAAGDTLSVLATATPATGTFDLLGGANVVSLATGVNISGATYTATGGTVSYTLGTSNTMTIAQNALIGSAPSANTVTLSDIGTVTGNAAVENYVLPAGINNFTVGATTQNVTASTLGVNTVVVPGLTLGAAAYVGANSDDVLSLATASNIAAATVGADFVSLTIASGGSVTMTPAQNTAFSGTITAPGTETITLSATGATTARANVENYVLSAAGNNLTVLAGTNVVGGAAADTVTVSGLTATGTYTGLAAADTILAASTANIVGVNGGAATGAGILDISNFAAITVSMSAAQHNAFTTVNVNAVDDIIELNSRAGVDAVTAKTTVLNYSVQSLGSGTPFVLTLSNAAQNLQENSTLTTVVLDGALGNFTGNFNSDFEGSQDVLRLVNSANISTLANSAGNADGFTILDLNNAAQTVTMTQAQHEALSTVNNTTGIQTVAVTTTGAVTARVGIESYDLSGAIVNNITVNAAQTGVNITGAAAGAKTVTIGGNTVNGTYALANGADVIVATTGANIAGINTSAATTAETLDLTGAITLTAAQAAGFTTVNAVGGGDSFALTTAATSLSLVPAAGVETVTLGNFTNSVTQGAVGQIINGTGAGVDTVTAITGVTSISDLMGGANVVVVPSGANISAGTFNATGGTVGYNVDATDNTGLTATLTPAQAVLITSAGAGNAGTGVTNKVTLSAAVAATNLLPTSVETYTLGGAGNNVVFATNPTTTNTVVGASATDVITLGTGTNGVSINNNGVAVSVSGNTGNDTVNFTAAATGTVTAGAGADVINFAAGVNSTVTVNDSDGLIAVNGGTGNETLTFTSVLNSGASIVGGTGSDTVNLLSTGNNSNTFSVAQAGGTLTVNGSIGNDTLTLITTALTNITLNTGAGADTIALPTVGATANTVSITDSDGVVVNGSTNADAMTFTTGVTATTVFGGLGADTLQLAAAANTLTVNDTDGIVVTAAGTFNDNITFSSSVTSTTVIGIDGNDTITLSSAGNTLAVTQAAGTVSVAGSTGIDALTFTGNVTATVTGGTGADTILLQGTGTNTLTVNDTDGVAITGTAGSVDNITFGTNVTATTVTGGASGADTIVLAAGTNTLTVNDTSVTISGGTNNTINFTTTAVTAGFVTGGSGVDNITASIGFIGTISTGLGDDVITLAAANNSGTTITGGAGLDTINLGAVHAGNVNVVLASALAADADTISNFIDGGARDNIQLSKAVFPALTSTVAGSAAGLDAAGDFVSLANAGALTTPGIATATDAQPLIFLADSGSLYYNADLATAGGLVLIATGLPATFAITDFVLTA
jgi:Ca2+-binding RTX toxin-like protein